MGFPVHRDLVVPQGADFDETYTWFTNGPDGARQRGDWTIDNTYLRNDVVAYTGTVYAALSKSTGAQPDTSPDSWEALTPTDLTGWTALLVAKERVADDPTLSLTDVALDDGSGVLLGGTAGTVQVKIVNARSALLPDVVLRYDLKLVSPGNLITPFMKGLLISDPGESGG